VVAANRTPPTAADAAPTDAGLVTGGTLDTKGGPRTNTEAQLLDDTGTPISGLCGVGDCVASPSAQAYWAGGATLGPIIAFAHRVTQAADREPIREPGPLAATPS
jgi:3-oxosteroid 1-dehydrogenase